LTGGSSPLFVIEMVGTASSYAGIVDRESHGKEAIAGDFMCCRSGEGGQHERARRHGRARKMN